ncbi:hypothetical protein HY745_11225 [Candidatus Desantisbacteria bacterium]|nr:hypothetical protein [Candidatus Desantisbacteria bacterium]
MDNSIIVALIEVSGSIIAFVLTKRHEMKSEWKKEKLNHFKVLLSSLSALQANNVDKIKAFENFALAFNTIALVAPQAVINALIELHKKCKNNGDYIEPLKKLMLEIRKDIGLSKKDNPKTFNFYFIDNKVGDVESASAIKIKQK